YEEKLRLFNFDTCGLTSSTYVSDGTNWTLPWLGFVRANNEFKSRCVVTLVSEWYAVGPALCFENDGVEAFVLVGNGVQHATPECFDRNGTTLCTQPTQTLRIQRVIIHPKFGTNSTVDNIALVEFLNPANITQPNVQPICLPVMSDLRASSRTNLHVASISFADDSYKNIPTTYLDSADCMREYADRNISLNLQNKQICAVITNKQDEQDCKPLIAGAPLQERIILRNKERYFLRGYELFGHACHSKAAPVYNNLEAYLDWILYNMRYNEADVEGTGGMAANSSLASQWLQLQQEPGNEKLRLFNMSACGVALVRNERIGQIVINPWAVMFFGVEDLTGQNVKAHGLGVLINEWYILTSAHTVLQQATWRSIIYGMYNVLLQTECVGPDCLPFGEATIASISVHPNYGKDPRNYNIALVELQHPINFTMPHIAPICMPLLRDLHKSKPLELIVSSDDDLDIKSKTLTELNPTVCQRQLAQEGFLTSAKTVPWCAVDSYQRAQSQLLLNAGAPLQALMQFDEQRLYFLRGINVRNNLPNELPYLPELFTNVDRFLTWILDNMKVKHRNVTWPGVVERSTPKQVNLMPVQNTSKRSLVNLRNCGIIPTTNETANRTFIPWMGYLSSSEIFLNASKHSRCAVTLINEWYAVGLAGCFSGKSNNYSVLFGINSVETPMECTELEQPTSCVYPTQRIPVEKIIIHPHFNSYNYRNDIALVKLARPVDTSHPNVKPICLPVLDEIRSYNTSSLVAVSEDEPGSIYLLNTIDGRNIDSAECQRRWEGMALQFAIENHKICILLEIAPNNECYDLLTGSSLHSIQRINSEERHFLRGIKEIKPKHCTLHYPVLYTDTDMHLDWILENIDESPAHCFANDGIERWILLGGTSESSTHPTQALQIERIITHPKYDSNNFANNIVLIELLTAANTTLPNIRPICIPATPELRMNEMVNISVASFGAHANSYAAQPVRLVSTDHCKTEYAALGFTISWNNKRFCAQLSPEDGSTCSSLRSGAPLQEFRTYGDTGRYFLRGFELFGLACATETPPVYNNLDEYLDWILYNMRYNILEKPEAVKPSNAKAPQQTLETEWAKLQQQPGKENLRLFNMSTCGLSATRNQNLGKVTIFPWVGFFQGAENQTDEASLTKSLAVLISEWYALVPRVSVTNNMSWRLLILGRYNPDDPTNCYTSSCEITHQFVEIKNVIVPPSDHPRQMFALVELLFPANLSIPYIRPICLPFMEQLHRRKPTQVVLVSNRSFATEGKKLTMIDYLNCQQRLLLQNHFVTFDGDFPCAIEAEKFRQLPLSSALGSTIQVPVRIDGRARYFLYGIDGNQENLFSDLTYGPYLFGMVTLADLEWIMESMQVKEEQTSLPSVPTVAVRERVSLNPVPQANKPKRSLFNFRTCGINAPLLGYSDPWIGNVFSNVPFFNVSRCSVTLISEWYAVGPAYCFVDVKQEHFIKFGVANDAALPECLNSNMTTDCQLPIQRILVQNITIHPEYDRASYRNDIALVKLATPADTSQPNVKPICLPILNETRSYERSNLTMASNTKFEDTQVGNRYLDTAECHQRWKGLAVSFDVGDSHICVITKRTLDDDCVSVFTGASLHTTHRVQSIDRHFLRGFDVIIPRGCSIYYPPIYIDTDPYLSWILESMDETVAPSGVPFDLHKELVFTD
uniref:Peptidase S1 domain-containing protein n=1 Tax=Anopheles minimus TaxID=112268 RepID=A0A182W973_9DIPT